MYWRTLCAALGAGGSFEDALRACLTATRLSGLLGLPDEQHTDVYYLPLMALEGVEGGIDDGVRYSLISPIRSGLQGRQLRTKSI